MSTKKNKNTKSKSISISIEKSDKSQISQISKLKNNKYSTNLCTKICTSIKSLFSKLPKDLMSIVAILSTIIGYTTVKEMRIDRDYTYIPSLIINPQQYSISLDSNGTDLWIQSQFSNEGIKASQTEENYIISETISLPIVLMFESNLNEMTIVNVGNGTAKNIVISWSENNIENLVHYLETHDSSQKDFCHSGKSVSFDFDEGILIVDDPKDLRWMYMLSNSEEKYEFSLPAAYSILFREIIKTCDISSTDFPFIHFYANYDDIQGKAIKKSMIIYPQNIMPYKNSDGSGSITYQLVASEGK